MEGETSAYTAWQALAVLATITGSSTGTTTAPAVAGAGGAAASYLSNYRCGLFSHG